MYENGRRYHSLNAGNYSVPNDEVRFRPHPSFPRGILNWMRKQSEQDRLDMYHHATSLMLKGALHVAVLPKKLDRILDLGTGTGIWAIDMADEHPKSSVFGADLSPIQPSWVPPNCTFEVDDITRPWLWKEPFDFIHSANLSQGIRDWPEYVQRIYDNLVPGGVVEIRESQTRFHTDDDSKHKGGFLEKYENDFIKSAAMAGINDVCEKLQGFVEDAGFVDVKVVVKKLPLGAWPKDRKKKELGAWGLAIMEQGFKSYGIALFTRCLEMSTEDAEELCDRAFDELRRQDVHIYAAE